MRKRALGNTGLMVSELSLGCEHLQGKDEALVRAVVNRAIDGGVNFFDVFMSEPNVRDYIGRALAERDEHVALQGHIGATWRDGQYEVSRALDMSKRFFEDLLTRYQRDRIEVGMIHNLDDAAEWDRLLDSDYMRYALSLKEQSTIGALGLSCHNPVTALKAVKSGLIDVLMFSLNPAYDLLSGDVNLMELFAEDTSPLFEGVAGIHPDRAALYAECARRGVGITVMKALGAGALLNPARSPFEKPLTVYQALAYALDRPAVSAVMLGMQTVEEVDHALQYCTLPAAALDYAETLSQTTRYSLKGRCMYCNHCLPCPKHIDIAAVNKYLDMVSLSGAAPETVAAHYRALERTAADCISCGICEKRCPFGVPVVDKMKQARQVFG